MNKNINKIMQNRLPFSVVSEKIAIKKETKTKNFIMKVNLLGLC